MFRLAGVVLPLLALAAAILGGAADPVAAARISDIRNTKHNLSSLSGNPTRATSETQVCVFCHTPHAATQQSPLWNRQLSTADGGYTLYNQNFAVQGMTGSIEASIGQPAGRSRLCLSCHDGVMTIGNVSVLNGAYFGPTPQTSGAAPVAGLNTTMPAGQGATTGFTRNLGTNLENDHPISFTYDTALASADGELAAPGAFTYAHPRAGNQPVVGPRATGTQRPLLPLEPNGAVNQMQCHTCHDPHLRETDTQNFGQNKFLRANRFQGNSNTAAPAGNNGGPVQGQYNADRDIICLACHDKAGWALSAHADPVAADERYRNVAATTVWREFPSAAAPANDKLPVWRAACLNCHDTHTVQGARKLGREGTDSLASPKAGGNPATEEVCYSCHSPQPAATSLLVTNTGVDLPADQVPDIKTEFSAGTRMPITRTGTNGLEVHDIGSPGPGSGKDFLETPAKLGFGNLANRHAECTDCHNPHRVMKAALFNAAANSATQQTHDHNPVHSNIASGPLKGSWGVEPNYTTASFQSTPNLTDITFTRKSGNPPPGAATAVTSAYVTREYQICLKCHSHYAYNDDNVYPTTTARPQLSTYAGTGTVSGTNGLTVFTNQAKEFQPAAGHQGQAANLGTAAGAGSTANGPVNHRSWHPVIGPTGRTATSRTMDNPSNMFLAPWRNGITGAGDTAVGIQTMYCSDCHGANSTALTSVPEGTTPWGPHGSANNFILKGAWSTASSDICLRCHNPEAYQTSTNRGNRAGWRSGFGGGGRDTNLHAYHADRVRKNLQCNWCHVTVPHGWKNKALLVNLNDIGPEAGQPATGNVEFNMNGDLVAYTQGPYYMNAKNKVINFRASGNWVDTDCGSLNQPTKIGATANTTGNGINWMKSVCANPP